MFGIEYRDRKSDKRFGITPSLISRYTTGTALGVKMRTKFGSSDWLVLAVALTNGSNTTEQFHFYDEIDSNAGKTASGRLAVRLPLSIEIGVSGSTARRTARPTTRTWMWFYGVGSAGALGPRRPQGPVDDGRTRTARPSQDVYGLRAAQGGYLELDVMLTSSFGVLGRGEYRDAFVWLGTSAPT